MPEFIDVCSLWTNPNDDKKLRMFINSEFALQEIIDTFKRTKDYASFLGDSGVVLSVVPNPESFTSVNPKRPSHRMILTIQQPVGSVPTTPTTHPTPSNELPAMGDSETIPNRNEEVEPLSEKEEEELPFA